jgi:hypothetical protein
VRHIGETATVCGVVASAEFEANARSKPTLLDLGEPSPRAVFTVVIYGDNRPKFSTPETALRGKRVCVTGQISNYQGKPERPRLDRVGTGECLRHLAADRQRSSRPPCPSGITFRRKAGPPPLSSTGLSGGRTNDREHHAGGGGEERSGRAENLHRAEGRGAEARTCYDYLAGRLGVALSDALIGAGHIELATDGGIVTESGFALLDRLGIDVVRCALA